MKSFNVSGRAYQLGDMTARKALALAELWAVFAHDGSSKLGLSETIRRGIAALDSVGCDVADEPVHVLVEGLTEYMRAAAIEWSPYLSREALPKINELMVLASTVASMLQEQGAKS